MSDYVAPKEVDVPVSVALRAEKAGGSRIARKKGRGKGKKKKEESNKRRRQRKQQDKEQRENIDPNNTGASMSTPEEDSRENSPSSNGGGLMGMAAAASATAVPTYTFLKQKLDLAEEKLGLFNQQKQNLRSAAKAFKNKKEQAFKLSKKNPNLLVRVFGSSLIQPGTKGMQKGKKIRQSHIRINNKLRGLHAKKHRSWDAMFD
jgi:hypothetical protein